MKGMKGMKGAKVLAGEKGFGHLGGHGVETRVGRGQEFGDELLLGHGGDALALGGVVLGGLGLGFKAVGAAAGQVEELGALVVMSEAGEFGEQFAKALPAVLGFGGGSEDVAGGEGEASGEHGGEFFGEDRGRGAGMERVGVFGELGEVEAGLLEALPIQEAALFPAGEVGLGDGFGVEVGGEECLDFREGVEPVGEEFGFVAVIEALVELVADGAGEAGDFAGAGAEGSVGR